MRPFLPLVLAGALAACAPGMPQQRLITDPAVAARAEAALAAGPSRDASSAMGLGGTQARVITVAQGSLPPVINQRVIRNAALDAQMERILQRISRGWTASGRPAVRVVLVADAGYSALATSANIILVNIGVLERAQSEDEVAFIIGHEYAHILLGHLAERARNTRNMRTMTEGGYSLAATGVAMAQRNAAVGAAGGNALVGMTIGANLVLALADELVDTHWSREQETEADRLGFDLLARAGYSPGAFAPVLSAIAQAEEGRSARTARLRNSFAGAGALATQQVGNRVGGIGGLVIQLGGTLAGRGLDEGMGQLLGVFTGTHGSAAERQAALVVYSDTLWKDHTAGATPSPFASGRLQAQLAPMLRLEAQIRDINQAIAEDRLEEAERMLQPARRGTPGDIQRQAPTAFHVARGRIAVKRGQFDLAIQELTAAERAPDPHGQVFTELADAFLGARRPVDALATLDRAERRFGTDEPFVTLRLRALRASGNEAGYATLYARCDRQMTSDLSRLCRDVDATLPPARTAS